MSDILHKVQMFLDTACQKQVVIPDKLIDEFGEACKNAIKKQFTDKRPNKFTIRASNIGRPLCQLQMEKDGAKGESPPYSTKMRNLLGDLIEATAVLILKSSGVKVTSEQKSVRYTFPDGTHIDGTFDVEIDKKIWDIKSASPFAFEHKFKNGFTSLVADDSFGYLSQGYVYAEADKKKFGGWIAINKSTGEWTVTETPLADDEHKKKAIEMAYENAKSIVANKPFKRCFTDIEETYRRKPTGNRILNFICGYCSYKKPCWGDEIQYLPQQQSQGQRPKWVWYTQLNNPKKEYENTK